MSTPKKVAREVRRNPALRATARAGFVANGVVHLLMGVLALAVATGSAAESDQSGALRAIASAPLGLALIWLVAVALGGLSLWNIIDGVVPDARGASGTAQRWGKRLASWGRAALYLTLAIAAASVALGARNDTDESVQSGSRDLLAIPGGPIALGVIGAVIGGAGVTFAVLGLMRSFRKLMTIPDGLHGKVVTGLGIFGYLAKGLALLVVGVLLLVAAVRLDPSAAGGIDGALHALLGTPLGPLAVGAIGGGLIAYGIFSTLRARYEDL